jgi:hypothetical protein
MSLFNKINNEKKLVNVPYFILIGINNDKINRIPAQNIVTLNAIYFPLQFEIICHYRKIILLHYFTKYYYLNARQRQAGNQRLLRIFAAQSIVDGWRRYLFDSLYFLRFKSF